MGRIVMESPLVVSLPRTNRAVYDRTSITASVSAVKFGHDKFPPQLEWRTAVATLPWRAYTAGHADGGGGLELC